MDDIYTTIKYTDYLIGQITPRELTQIYPIAKSYDGNKFTGTISNREAPGRSGRWFLQKLFPQSNTSPNESNTGLSELIEKVQSFHGVTSASRVSTGPFPSNYDPDLLGEGVDSVVLLCCSDSSNTIFSCIIGPGRDILQIIENYS
ncbi:MAG: hypothetical protein PHG14_09830 [Desulfobacter postgatei]|uniref:hypothetical protein n=1 Tax=Desulfobacter postgatei TaxID=2293 RepID=UPI0023F16675|nr:hypothetical protein [Desulfobacter postgatei]MDD4274011.1 hypothetical protein [Desulfobacter postgatei]